MKHRTLLITLFILLFLPVVSLIGYYFVAEYLGYNSGELIEPGEKVVVDEDVAEINETPEKITNVKTKLVQVAEDLYVPWSIVFIDTNTALVSERNGQIRLMQNDSVSDEVLFTFAEALSQEEAGLMSLAVDPNFEMNRYVYACVAYDKYSNFVTKIERLTFFENKLNRNEIILDDIPAAQYHAGCRIKFGPDDKLYITTGDATNKDLPQDKESPAGKILRINNDGSIPSDNPFPDNPVWSYGHRNPQGIDWDAGGVMYSSEHGPSVFDGPAGGDEINLIVKGSNYGWPLVSHDEVLPEAHSPLIQYTPAEAPGSLMIYKSDLIPQYTGNIFFGALKGEGLMRVIVDPEEPSKIISYEKLSEINFGRIRDVVESPSGEIYITTSNQDGRGTLREGDDKVYKITLE